MKASVNLLSNNLTPLPNKLQDKVENMVVKHKFKTVTQIALYSFLKPTDQKCNVCTRAHTYMPMFIFI